MVAGTDTASPTDLPAAVVSKTESTSIEAPAVKPPILPEAESLPDVFKKTFPGATSVRSESYPFPHRVVRDSDGRVLGFEAFSDSAGTTAKGYAGMVPLRVFLSASGRPVRIYMLENCETPRYLEVIYRAGLLDRLLLFDPAKPDSFDAVALATWSSRAVIDGVTALAVRVATELVPAGSGAR